jgi:hypothetical protein
MRFPKDAVFVATGRSGSSWRPRSRVTTGDEGVDGYENLRLDGRETLFGAGRDARDQKFVIIAGMPMHHQQA